MLSAKGITERGNSICKGPMIAVSMKDHSGKKDSDYYSRNTINVVQGGWNGIRMRNPGEEEKRDKTVKGYVCTIRNFSLILRAM